MHELFNESNLARSESVKFSSKKKKATSQTKILLLGTGNSGKSTVFKQFQLVHNHGFSLEEREHCRKVMIYSAINSIKKLMQYCSDLLFEGDLAPEEESDLFMRFSKNVQRHSSPADKFISLNQLINSTKLTDVFHTATTKQSQGGNRDTDLSESSLHEIDHRKVELNQVISDEVSSFAEVVKNLPEGTELNEMKTVIKKMKDATTVSLELSVADILVVIWEDPVIQKVYAMEGKMPTLEAPIGYYMKHIQRLASKDFMPTDEDMLHSRKQTRIVQHLEFKVQNKDFVLTDVGGQRIERRQWLTYFEGVDVVMFIVGLDGYNQVCLEDGRTNRVKEALLLFKEICESPYFASTSFLLFLNKSDIFKEKISSVPLSVCFRSYKGHADDSEESLKYLSKRFLDIHTRSVHRRVGVDMLIPKVYPYITCATDPEKMKFVITSCQAIFLRQGMAACGIAAM